MIRRTVREWDYLHVEPAGSGAFSRKLADKIVAKAAASKVGGTEGDRIFINHPAKLRAQQTVGVIVADGAAIEILPKIEGVKDDASARRALVHMLAAVFDLDVSDGDVTELGWQNEDILEILIRLFCDRLFEAVHRGLPRRYIEQEDDLRALKGRLNVVRQLTILATSPDRLACRFDELSSDIPLNQVMKAAVTRLGKIARAAENRRRLTELAFAFADVSMVPPSALPWDKIVIDRTNRAWSQLLALAKLLLGARFQTTSLGLADGFSLLFEMNTLFEEFIGRQAQRAMRGSGLSTRLQGPRDYALRELQTEQRRFATKPDITLGIRGEPQLIIDTKWKRLKGAIDDPKNGVAQADIYQMMAYAHVYRCERLMLLYPHHDALSAAPGIICEHHISGTANTNIIIATVSLKQPRLVVHALRSLIHEALGNVGAGVAAA